MLSGSFAKYLAFLGTASQAAHNVLMMHECASGKIIDIDAENVPVYSDEQYYKIEAQVWFPQEILAKSHFFGEMQAHRLEELEKYFTKRVDEEDPELTMEFY